jgi:hypothetical protein
MATRALDVVTIIRALKEFEKELKISEWFPGNPLQLKVFDWLKKYGLALDSVTGLKALASRDCDELNRFLVQNKFNPVIQPFNTGTSLGVVAIVDKLIKWLHGPGEIVDIQTEKGLLPGFKLPAGGVNVYQVEGYKDSHLLELLTKTEDTLWLFIHPDLTITGLDLVDLSLDVMSKQRKIAKLRSYFGDDLGEVAFAGAKIPMLDFDISPDISWLCDAGGIDENKLPFSVEQAFQQFKMRMDETGARVKVATAMVMRYTAMVGGPSCFVVDTPFYGWWMQKGVPFPMASFFADYDSLKKPVGSLEDL